MNMIDTHKVFLIAGEASGDTIGGGLMEALNKIGDFKFSGIGGDAMTAQGLESLMPMDQLCVMGIFEVALQIPRLLKLIDLVVHKIEEAEPDMLVTIDLPDFNFRVAEKLKKRGIFKGKIYHYVAPTVWAWRPGRAKKIAKFLDGLLCLFPFEPQYFKAHKLTAHYVGHPLIVQDFKEKSASFAKFYDLKDEELVFSVYLGSRAAEIKKHKDVFIDVVNFMAEQYPNMQVFLPTLPRLEYQISQIREHIDAETIIVTDPEKKWDVMRNSDMALAVSGTVGLELAVMNTPHAIAYRTSLLTYLIARMLVKIRFAHLGNIILDKPAIPEFIQTNCRPLFISKELLRLLGDDQLIAKQKLAFHDIRKALKKDITTSPGEMAAHIILEAITGF